MKAPSSAAERTAERDRLRIDPAPLGDLQDREDAEHQRARDQGGAGEVGAFVQAETLAVLDQAQRQPGDGDADRQVDEEDPVPADRLGEDAAERAGRSSRRRRRRSRRRRSLSPASPAPGTSSRSSPGSRPRRAPRRCPGRSAPPISISWLTEAAQSSEAAVKMARPTRKTRRWPTQVAEPSRQQQQAAEGDHVGVDDPGQLALAEAEIVLDRRQGDVDDRRVEDDHQHARAEHVEGEPAGAVFGLFGGVGSHAGRDPGGGENSSAR